MLKKLSLCLLVSGLFLIFAAGNALAAKTQVCHIPPGNPDNFHTISINDNALSAHLAHGDFAGTCDDYLDMLCDDGNACTQDVANGACISGDRPTVDCNDGNNCTADSCDSVSGQCVNAAIICTSPDLCTVSACNPNSGECVNSPQTCSSGSSCDLNTGQCELDAECGNGIQEEGEQCDGEDFNFSCPTGYSAVCNANCAGTCEPDPSSCGDGSTDAGEICDPSDPATATVTFDCGILEGDKTGSCRFDCSGYTNPCKSGGGVIKQ